MTECARAESADSEEGRVAEGSAEPHVLVVDDDPGFSTAVSRLIASLGYRVTCVENVEEANQQIKVEAFDHIFLDLMLPDGSGLELLGTLDDLAAPKPKVTLVTGDPSVKQMIRRMYGPRVSYLLKPLELSDLERALNLWPSPDQSGASDFEGLIGPSRRIEELHRTIERVAASSANIMIMGESGVGKELVARSIHRLSGAAGPLVTANASAFNRELIGSELFGHEKGAFTGAVARRKGLFEQAEGGTLFLDEITEMPHDLQANLLRVLETKRCVRIGGTTPIEVNCRVVSATNRTERDMAQEKMLRTDLFFRLAAFPIKVPPLRHRKEDIAALVHRFVQSFNEEYGVQLTCPDSAIHRLEAYDWPGNVRELRHTIHRAVILSGEGEELQLPETIGSPFGEENAEDLDFVLRPGQSIQDVEKRLIELTLDRYGDDKKQAAALLGVSLKTLYNRLKTYADESESESLAGSAQEDDDG